MTPAERRVWDGFAAGGEVSYGEGDPRAAGFDPASWGEERTVRAEVLTRLLLGAGPLDLNATVLDCELIAVNCYFDGVVDLGDAQSRSLELAACRVMALNMWDMRVDGGLDFYGLTCGSIVLGNSRVAGDLRLDEATFSEPAGEGVVVDGMVDLSRAHAFGPINLRGVRISGSLEAQRLHALLGGGDEAPAVDLELATIGGI